MMLVALLWLPVWVAGQSVSKLEILDITNQKQPKVLRSLSVSQGSGDPSKYLNVIVGSVTKISARAVISGGGIQNVEFRWWAWNVPGKCSNKCKGTDADFCQKEGVGPYVVFGDNKATGEYFVPPNGCEFPLGKPITMRMVLKPKSGSTKNYFVGIKLKTSGGQPPPTPSPPPPTPNPPKPSPQPPPKEECFDSGVPKYYNAKNGKWTRLKNKGPITPKVRHETGACLIHDRIYLIGGRGWLNVAIWDPKVAQWTYGKVKTPNHHHFQPVAYGNNIYIATGMTGGFPHEVPLKKIWIYYAHPTNPNKDTYKESDILIPRPRGGGACVVHQDKIWLVSGILDGHFKDTTANFDSFDFNCYKNIPNNLNSNQRKTRIAKCWAKHPDVPHKRDHTSATILWNKMYLIGGRISDYGVDGNVFDDVIPQVDVWDFNKKKWLSKSQAPPAISPGRAAPCVFTWQNRRIIAAGGETGNNPKAENVVQEYNPKTNKWRYLKGLDTAGKDGPRHGFGCVPYHDYVFAIAGSPNRGAGNMNDVLVWPFPSKTGTSTCALT